jgi:hypothetical protein
MLEPGEELEATLDHTPSITDGETEATKVSNSPGEFPGPKTAVAFTLSLASGAHASK